MRFSLFKFRQNCDISKFEIVSENVKISPVDVAQIEDVFVSEKRKIQFRQVLALLVSVIWNEFGEGNFCWTIKSKKCWFSLGESSGLVVMGDYS